MGGLDRVIDVAKSGRLAVLAGAGISMLPPANLPGWGQFTTALLAAAVAKATTAPFLDQDATAAIRSLTPDSITTATLSEAIAKYVASVRYFPVLTVLDGATTNANHGALADLASRGSLRAIVTPNFDTLIERAFQERGVPLSMAGARTGAAGDCALIRLHGVATSALSMIDTLGQKVRGLSFDTHATIRQRLRDCGLLVVGFSGVDLDFADDYLSLEATPFESLTWVVRSNEAPGPQVEALRTRLGDRMQIVSGDLPGLWRDLGATIPDEAVAAHESAAAVTASRVSEHTRELFDELGAPLAVTLCMRLLDDSGQRERAVRVFDRLADIAGTWSAPRHATQMTVLRALSSSRLTTAAATVAWQERDVECCRRRLDEFRQQSSQAPAVAEGSPVAQEAEFHFLLAIGLGNLASSYAGMSKLGSAERTMWDAHDHALMAADLRALAGAWYAYGLIQLQADEPLSPTLWSLLVAEGAAVAGGNLDNAYVAALMRGRLLMTGGEYDQAEICFKRCAERAKLSGKREWMGQVLASQAMLACRRHQLSKSLRLFDEARQLTAGIAEASARVRWEQLRAFSNEPDLRATLLGDCDALLAQLRDGLVPEPVSGLPDASMILGMKAHLHALHEFRPPPFLAEDDTFDALPEEARLRRLLVNCEYVHDRVGVATVLKGLTELTTQANDDPRAEELATAYELATAALDVGRRVDARMLLSQAAYRLGDLNKAREAMRGLEHLELAFDPGLERRRRAWLSELRPAPRRSPHPYLLIRNLAAGVPSLRAPASARQRTAASLIEVAQIVAQVILCQLLQEYRDGGDHAGVASCYALLARSAAAAGRQPLAIELERMASAQPAPQRPRARRRTRAEAATAGVKRQKSVTKKRNRPNGEP